MTPKRPQTEKKWFCVSFAMRARKVKLLRWVSMFEIANGSRKTPMHPCWGVEGDVRSRQIPLSLLNLDSLEAHILRNFDLIIFFFSCVDTLHEQRTAQLFSTIPRSFVHFCVYGGLFIRNWMWRPFMEVVCLCSTFSHSMSFLEKNIQSFELLIINIAINYAAFKWMSML